MGPNHDGRQAKKWAPRGFPGFLEVHNGLVTKDMKVYSRFKYAGEPG